MSIMLRDALLHFVHFVCIFALASLLVGEALVLKQTLSRERVAQLQSIDRWFGIMAGVVIASGLLLVFFGAKGAAYYAHNGVFWAKMVVFVAIALISIAPTLAFVGWNKRAGADGSIVLDAAEYGRLRALIWLEIALFVLLPFFAALMANGLGAI